MAIAAARPHAFVVAAMLRVLEKRVVGLQRHGVTGRAKRVGARVAVHRGAEDDRIGRQ